jgi:branched-chain amino acid transport system substrate-binding protein
MINRRVLLVGAPLVVGALSLAGCGSSKGGSSSGSSAKTYTIAYQGPLSGGNAQLGLNMKFAVQLAVNNANAGKTFGSLPFKLKFTSEDDQGSPTQGPTAAQKILQDNSVIGVVGPAFSGATRASEPFFSQDNVASVSPSATAADLTTHGWKNFFRVVADDNAQGPADALYIAKGLKLTKVYVVDDASAYAAGLAKAFIDATSSNGLTVVKHETAPGTTQCQAGSGNVQQYNSLATKIKGSDAEVVFYAGYYCDFALMAKQLRAAGYTGKLFSDDGSKDDKYVSQAGASVAEGTYVSCACEDNISGSTFTQFSDDFKKLAGFAVGTYSAEAYDAANVIISAMKSLGKNVTRSGVIDKLHASDFSWDGLSKKVTFQSSGNVAGNAVFVYQVKNGKIEQLGDIGTLVGG